MSAVFRVRLATISDNNALIDLVRRCPIKGSLDLVLDRFPDYFALSRLQGEHIRVFVAETPQGEVVGSAALIERQEHFRDKSYRTLRFSDVRTDPRFRKSRIAAAFIALYREELLTGGFDYGTTEILEGNHAPIAAHHLLGDSLEVEEEGFVHVYQLLPLWKLPVSPQYRIRSATPSDIGRICSLLKMSYRDSAGRPEFTEAWLEATLRQHASFAIENIELAEDSDGVLHAVLARWDQKDLRQMICLRFDRAARWLVRMMTLLGLLWKLPPIPRTGRPLRCIYLRWPACRDGSELALQALVRKAVNDARLSGEYHFLAIGFHEGDSLRSCLDGIMKVKSRMHLYRHRVKAVSSPLGPALLPDVRPFADPALI